MLPRVLRSSACLALSLLLVAFFGQPTHGDGSRHAYSVVVAPAVEGAVRAPSRLAINSTPEIPLEKQLLLAWHFRNAARLAPRFAEKEGLAVQRADLPAQLEICESPRELAELTGMPKLDRLGLAVARINLQWGIIYLSRKTPSDLYCELGKWLFYPRDYAWGANRSDDLAHVRLIKRFANFCLDDDNWTETGGSSKSIY